MQYILTEEEYQNLAFQKTARIKLEEDKLLRLCVNVADNMPITEWPGSADNPKPWGCRINKKHEWYCDRCIMQEICPVENIGVNDE